MKKLIRKKTIKRKCDKCGILRGTTITTKKYYCESCIKKYFKDNFGKQPKEIRIIETEIKKIDWMKVLIAIISFVIGLIVGKVL